MKRTTKKPQKTLAREPDLVPDEQPRAGAGLQTVPQQPPDQPAERRPSV